MELTELPLRRAVPQPPEVGDPKHDFERGQCQQRHPKRYAGRPQRLAKPLPPARIIHVASKSGICGITPPDPTAMASAAEVSEQPRPTLSCRENTGTETCFARKKHARRQNATVCFPERSHFCDRKDLCVSPERMGRASTLSA